MNNGLFPGMTDKTETIVGSRVGFEVVTVSGTWAPKSSSFEIEFTGGGQAGRAGGGGGAAAGYVYKRVVDFPVGQVATVVFGVAGFLDNQAGGDSTVNLPGYPIMTATGGNGEGGIATGGDFNLAGQVGGTTVGSNIQGGGTGGSTPIGFGGAMQTGSSQPKPANGFGAGGAAGPSTGFTPGTPGGMLVRYYI